MAVNRAQQQEVQSLVMLKVAAAKVMLQRGFDPSLIDVMLKSGRDKRAISSDPLTMALIGAAAGGGLGGLSGLIAPGYAARGKRRSRLDAMFSRGAGGVVLGGIGGGIGGGLGSLDYSALRKAVAEVTGGAVGGTTTGGTPTDGAAGGTPTDGAAGGTPTGGKAGVTPTGGTAGSQTSYLGTGLDALATTGLVNQAIADARGGQSVIANAVKKIPLVGRGAEISATWWDKARGLVGLPAIPPSSPIPKILSKVPLVSTALGIALTGKNVHNNGWYGAGEATENEAWNALTGEYGWLGGAGTLAGKVFDPIGNAQSILSNGQRLLTETAGAAGAWADVAADEAKNWWRGR